MSPNEYQELALRTCSMNEFIDNKATTEGATNMSMTVHAILGLSDEVGEIAKMAKKHLLYGAKFDKVNIKEEVGDTLWYLALLLKSCDITLEEAMSSNIAKLKARYPEGFTSERAINRDTDTERTVLEST